MDYLICAHWLMILLYNGWSIVIYLFIYLFLAYRSRPWQSPVGRTHQLKVQMGFNIKILALFKWKKKRYIEPQSPEGKKSRDQPSSFFMTGGGGVPLHPLSSAIYPPWQIGTPLFSTHQHGMPTNTHGDFTPHLLGIYSPILVWPLHILIKEKAVHGWSARLFKDSKVLIRSLRYVSFVFPVHVNRKLIHQNFFLDFEFNIS